jgi:hypothetical protein
MVAQVTAKLLPVLLAVAGVLHGQDPREIVRKSVELDQADWARMKASFGRMGRSIPIFASSPSARRRTM